VIARRHDRETPEIPGHVPVQFRFAVEPAHLPSRPIAEDVRVVAAWNDRAFAAGIDADDAALAVVEYSSGLPSRSTLMRLKSTSRMTPPASLNVSGKSR
jgi:hypothetical protein